MALPRDPGAAGAVGCSEAQEALTPSQPRLPRPSSRRGGETPSSPKDRSSTSLGSCGSLAGAATPAPPENIERKFEEDFSQHLQKRNKVHRMQLGAVGASIGGAIGVAASPVLLPGLVVASLVGGAGGYLSARRWGRQERQRQSRDPKGGAEASELTAETALHGPPLRRLRYLVKWGHWQLLEYEDAPVDWRSSVLDEVFRAFSPWVQRMYLLRAKGQASEADPEARQVFHHLAPLYYLLQRRAAVDAIVQSAEAVAEAFASDTTDAVCEERCRIGYPTVLETISMLDRLTPAMQAQLHWETSGKTNASGFLGGEQPTLRRHRLQRIVDTIRRVLERADVQQALADRKHFHHQAPPAKTGEQPPAGDDGGEGGAAVQAAPHPQASSDEEDSRRELVVPPPGVENEPGAAGDEDEYFSVSEESGDEAAQSDAMQKQGSRRLSRAGSAPSPEGGALRAPFVERRALLPRGDADHTWKPWDASTFEVRSATYLQDRQKARSAPALLELVHVDFFLVGEDGPVMRVGDHSDFYPEHLRRSGDERFLFVQNWLFTPFQCIITGALDPHAAWLQDPLSPQARVWRKFLEADNDGRRELFKLILSLEAGPWLARRAVPKKPVLIGKKVNMTSHHVPGKYLEVVIDACSGRAEQLAVKSVCGALRRVQLVHSIVIEAREQEELPETLLIAASMRNLDPSQLRCPVDSQ